MYPASYFSLSMHTNIFGKLHQTMMSRVILVRTDTKLKGIARHWEDFSDLENVLHNIIIWSYSFPAPNASLLTQFCALSLPSPVSKNKNKQKMKPQITISKAKPQKNGKMSKQQNSGVHFVLAKYFWVWSLFWNAVNIHKGTFPFPSRYRL